MHHNLKVYGALCSIYLFFAITPIARAESPLTGTAPLQESSIALAREKKLHASREWMVLLHYRPNSSGVESLVDDPAFFLSPEGKTDPSAELAATIAGIYSSTEPGDRHPQCRFPARFEWLSRELGLNADSMPHPVCEKLDTTMKAIAPRSAVLVFPAAHNNGPASMFGHTLIKVGSSYKSDLLSHAVNYAAHATDTNGILYAVKGIFGLYPGYYSLLPYYEKLKEYGDLEHRDVWEYLLGLTPEEVRRMVLHIWELQDIRSDYFFFDENCSFNLLFLLEAARPSLRLVDDYWQRSAFWVIPADSIAVIRNSGLIEEIHYRPAQSTRIKQRARILSEQNQELAVAVTLQKTSLDSAHIRELPMEEKRQVLDLSAEYLQYRYSRRSVSPGEFQGQFLPILKARSTLGPGDRDAGSVPPPPQPEEGHLPAKIAFGGGTRGGNPFLQLFWQPAYHDLIDAEAGYTQGAQINFMSISGRYFPENGRFLLQRFRPVDIVSLATRDRFFQPVSWKVNAGLDRTILADGTDHLIFRLNTGGGLAWEIANSLILYGFAEADLNSSSRFREKVAAGIGASAGLLRQGNSFWTIHLNGSAFTYLLSQHQDFQGTLHQQFALSRRSAIGVKTQWQQSYDQTKTEAYLEYVRYF